MKLNFKKLIVLFLSSILILCSFSGCNNEISTPKEPAEVVVWTISNNEKVFQGEVELYEEYHDNKNIYVFAAKNEKEAGQFTITALNGSVSNYTIEVEDLTSASGNIFKKENIELFNQKYYIVGSPNDFYTKGGMYPDAMLPFETAVEFGENNVKEGNNQSISVRFDVPEDQVADLYEGSLKVTIDGEAYTVPVSLEVYDTTVSEEVHSRSSYAVSYNMELGEFDYSIEKRMTYLNFLAEYFLSGADIYKIDNAIDYFTEEGIEIWVDCYKQLYKNPKISTMKFPILRIRNSTYTMMNGEKVDNVVFVDHEKCLPILEKLLKESVEDNINYIYKLFFRGLDEPKLVGSTNSIEVMSDSYLKLVKESENYINTFKNGTNDKFIDELIASMYKIPIITTDYTIQDFHTVSYCPSYNKCATESDINAFLDATYNEMWWYGCNSPSAPYPTFHVDDSLIATRVVSWMQYDYDIVGNLYWAVDDWHSNTESWDFYDINTLEVREDGEGVLLYPGEPYGLETPVSSVRLESIRDGLEEYELLRSLELAYKAVNKDYTIDSIYDYFSDSLYSGSKVARDIETFESSRKALYELSQLSSIANFGIHDISIVDGAYTVKLFADSKYQIKSNGKVLSAVATNGSVNEYIDTFSLGNNVKGLNYSATVNGKDYTFEWILGSDSITYSAGQLENIVSKHPYSVDIITGLKSATDIGLTEDSKYVQLGISEITDDKWQKIILLHDVLSNINENTKTVVLNVYYNPQTENEEQYMKVSIQFTNLSFNSGVPLGKATVQLKKGMNSIEIDMSTINWKQTGALKYFEINYSEMTGQRPAVTDVYLKNITIMAK